MQINNSIQTEFILPGHKIIQLKMFHKVNLFIISNDLKCFPNWIKEEKIYQSCQPHFQKKRTKK